MTTPPSVTTASPVATANSATLRRTNSSFISVVDLGRRNSALAEAIPKLNRSISSWASESNDEGRYHRAFVLFAASQVLVPAHKTRASAANMLLKLGKTAEAAAEYEGLLVALDAEKSTRLEEIVRRKLAEAISGGTTTVARPSTRLPSLPSPAMSAAAVQLINAGQVANAEERFKEARTLFIAAFELGGTMQARISACNMTLKLGGAAVVEAVAEYEAILQLAEYEAILTSMAEALVRRKLREARELSGRTTCALQPSTAAPTSASPCSVHPSLVGPCAVGQRAAGNQSGPRCETSCEKRQHQPRIGAPSAQDPCEDPHSTQDPHSTHVMTSTRRFEPLPAGAHEGAGLPATPTDRQDAAVALARRVLEAALTAVASPAAPLATATTVVPPSMGHFEAAEVHEGPSHEGPSHEGPPTPPPRRCYRKRHCLSESSGDEPAGKQQRGPLAETETVTLSAAAAAADALDETGGELAAGSTLLASHREGELAPPMPTATPVQLSSPCSHPISSAISGTISGAISGVPAEGFRRSSAIHVSQASAKSIASVDSEQLDCLSCGLTCGLLSALCGLRMGAAAAEHFG